MPGDLPSLRQHDHEWSSSRLRLLICHKRQAQFVLVVEQFIGLLQ
jgi:hypothetical protein